MENNKPNPTPNTVKKPSFGGKLGYLLGCVVSSCITLLISSTLIALTAKLIIALIGWLF